jgi:ABC-2 type transport system permease protein
MTLFFPSMFLAGVYVPREALPTALQHVSDVTPLGAALQSFRTAWSGDLPRPLHLVTMAAYAVVAGLAAARFFRWE